MMPSKPWDLAFCRNPDRIRSLTELARIDTDRWDGTTSQQLQAPVRVIQAGTRFAGPPGQEDAAAEAWAFEMKWYFNRGVGEDPVVTYANGVYAVVGLITTTHGDTPGPDGIAWFA